ncbi:hypothetical protein CRYUN_Cryun05aG0117200 [Craigia yunnanensis]
MSTPWPHYPPCASGFCTDPACCSHEHKFSWPELVGMNGEVAKSQIEKDNPEVSVSILTPGRGGFADFCCNRVYVVVDSNGNVIKTPTIG